MMMGQPIRVLLVEDHELVRAGFTSLIQSLPGMEVVGGAANGRQALVLIRELMPDVVLMDITMPELNGLNAVGQIAAEFPLVRVIMLSMHDNEEYFRQALQAGAAGYLVKDADPAELELAIRSVARGGSYLSPAVSRHVVSEYVRGRTSEPGGFDRLTPRQIEIVQLIAEGHTNAEIAQILGVSSKTIETHRSQLMARLQIHDVTGIVRYAVRMGLVSSDR
jgi:DNA-binding NarL/FixJ family response regulator